MPLLLLLAACQTGLVDDHVRPRDTDESDREGMTRPEDYEPDLDTDQPDPDPVSEACYLGPNRDDGACLDVVEPSPMPDGYDYPPPYQGDPNYREPVAWLDLVVLDPSTSLAPNFQLSEFAEAYKGRYAVVGRNLVEHLQAMRDDLGALQVNSAYRNPDWNESVGGATYSRHQYGDAADITPLSASLTQLQDRCDDEDAGYIQVYTTHVHCDWRNEPVDEAFYGDAGRAAAAPLPVVDAWIEVDGDALLAPAEGFDEGEPLRVWRAYDARGAEIARTESETFTPPVAAARVEVDVGGLLSRSISLD